MEYIVIGSRNQNDGILNLLWSEFFETNATFRSASTDLGHALVVCDLTQTLVSGSGHRLPKRDQDL